MLDLDAEGGGVSVGRLSSAGAAAAAAAAAGAARLAGGLEQGLQDGLRIHLGCGRGSGAGARRRVLLRRSARAGSVAQPPETRQTHVSHINTTHD